MFTGIVEGMGQIAEVAVGTGDRRFAITAHKVFDGMEIGDSIAVNGVCLTAVGVAPDRVEVTAMTETLERTNLGALGEDDLVNLERPMLASGRFDGHLVQGHIDGVAVVEEISAEGDSRRIRFRADPALLRYVVEKGSITVDGVSLTVTAAGVESFELALIPHTLEITILGSRVVDDRVNIEVDILAKYVERLLEDRQ
jgi:riboflavin synthase